MIGSALDPTSLLDSYGAVGLLLIIFAECGLLIGFFLPGDSLLFAARLLIASGRWNASIPVLLVAVPVAATAGSIVGYLIGRKASPAIFRRESSRFLKRSHLERARGFFEARGGAAIIAARFVPVVRTFITVVAGATGMSLRRYAIYSIIVSFLWGAGLLMAGYWLGGVSVIATHVEIFAVLIAVVSLAPISIEAVKRRRQRIDA